MVSYRYNAGGQRIFKQVGSQAPEYYIMDGNQTVAVFENGAVKYWNLLANGVIGRRKANSEKLYYLKDHLGSTRAVVDGTGAVLEAHDYYPFGLLMPTRSYTTGEETREKFTGKELDGETGWYYHGARFRHPALGPWLSVDPLADKYFALTPFNYSGNNPINFLDPNGKWKVNQKDLNKFPVLKRFFEFAKNFSLGKNVKGIRNLNVIKAFAKLNKVVNEGATVDVFEFVFPWNGPDVVVGGTGNAGMYSRRTKNIHLNKHLVEGLQNSTPGSLAHKYFQWILLRTLLHETGHWASHSFLNMTDDDISKLIGNIYEAGEKVEEMIFGNFEGIDPLDDPSSELFKSYYNINIVVNNQGEAQGLVKYYKSQGYVVYLNGERQ